MSRDLADESYYVSRGGKIPVKWTSPEVSNTAIPNNPLNFSHFRLFTTRSTLLLVMCGVLVLSCTRYGAWDINLLKITPIIRY